MSERAALASLSEHLEPDSDWHTPWRTSGKWCAPT